MSQLSFRAEQQIASLARFYADRERPEAIIALGIAVRRALVRIESAPNGGLPAPRPYPELRYGGHAWVKEGAYWFIYRTRSPVIVIALFHDAADIPARL